METESKNQVGIMPTYRDLYPQLGAVGERFIIKHLKNLYLDDCLIILSKASQHYFKYAQTRTSGVDGQTVYKDRCYELLDPKTISALKAREESDGKEYTVIFPELSILHLAKLCLQNCDSSNSTKEPDFPKDVLFTIGKCLLVTNDVFHDAQLIGVSVGVPIEEIIVNFTKQMIVDHNFDVYQKFYQTYFIFDLISKNKEMDLEAIFRKCYGVTVKEYLAFSFALLSQFVIRNTKNEDSGHPHLDATALDNLRPQFAQKLLEDLLINNFKYKKIDLSFFNVFDITKRPLVKLGNGKIVVLSLRRLFLRLTDSVYFDILDNLTDLHEKDLFSKVYGQAVEDYFRDIIENIDPSAVKPFKYDNGQKETPDSILAIENDGLFFECKKKQFHTLEFLKNGDKVMFYERINDFYFVPLKQLCDRIGDFRNKGFSIGNLENIAQIYPIIICPLAPPIFSGGWDKLDLNKRVLPALYETDKEIALPEFIDLTELESIEEYLRLHPEHSFRDLISIKRADKENHNSNWIIILHKNGMNLRNSRLIDKYMGETNGFGEILFTEAEIRKSSN